MKKILCAAMAATLMAGSASAALITRTYDFEGTFANAAPFIPKTVQMSFTLTYDPTITVNDGAVTSYSTSSNYVSFQTTNPGYTTFANTALLLGTRDTGAVNGLNSQINDFYAVLGINSSGNYDPSSPFSNDGFGVSAGGRLYFADYSRVTVTDPNAPPPSVPEPATWAMFIGGFGLIGGAMRRRQKVSVSFG